MTGIDPKGLRGFRGDLGNLSLFRENRAKYAFGMIGVFNAVKTETLKLAKRESSAA